MATSRRLVIMAAVIFGVLLGGAPAAFAHATLEHSSPGSGSVLKQPPTKVILTFAESVGVAHGDIEVYDDHLHRVDLNDAGHPTGSGDTVGVRLAPDLHRGTYSVTWRVISADSHPISGGYTFSVGAPSMVTGKPPVLSGGHRSVGILLGAMRLLGYFGLIAGAGGLAFLLIWREGRTEPLLRRITGGGFAAGVVSAAGLFIIQAPYAQGSSLAHLFDGDLLNLVAHSHYGRAVAIRLALWLTAATAVTLWLHGVRRAAWLVVPLVVALPVTWAVAGHGDTGSDVWLSLASESLHVLAVAVWMGGLVVLSAHLLRREDRELIFAVLPRFSTVGLMSVATIVVTGLYQAWREIGLSWTALITTTYGRLVGAKMIGLAVLIGFGVFARWSLRTAAAPDDPDRTPRSVRQGVVQAHLRHSVFLELQIGAAILVLTAILVNTVPAKESVVYTEHRTLHAPGLQIEGTMTPSRTGTDTIDLAIFTADGYPRLAKSVTGSLSLPSKRISSLPVTFTPVPGQNHVIATASFPYAGTWSLTFDVATSAIDVTQCTTEFTVHAES